MSDCTKHPNWIKAKKQALNTQKLNWEKIRSDYNNNPNRCLYCNKSIPYNKKENKYCSSRCAGLNQSKRKHSQETKDKIRDSILKTPYNVALELKNKRECDIIYNKCISCK